MSAVRQRGACRCGLMVASRAALAVALCALPGAGGPAASAVPAVWPRAPADRAERAALDREIAELREDARGHRGRPRRRAAVELRRSQADLVAAQASLHRPHDGARAPRSAATPSWPRGWPSREAAAPRPRASSRTGGSRSTSTRGALGRIAREAYLSQGLGSLAVALDAESPDQFADRVTAVSDRAAGAERRDRPARRRAGRDPRAAGEAHRAQGPGGRAQAARPSRSSRQRQAAEQAAAAAAGTQSPTVVAAAGARR